MRQKTRSVTFLCMAAALQAMGILGYSFAMAVHSAMEYNSNTSH